MTEETPMPDENLNPNINYERFPVGENCGSLGYDAAETIRRDLWMLANAYGFTQEESYRIARMNVLLNHLDVAHKKWNIHEAMSDGCGPRGYANRKKDYYESKGNKSLAEIYDTFISALSRADQPSTVVEGLREAINRYGPGASIQCHGNSWDHYIIDKRHFNVLYEAAKLQLKAQEPNENT